MEASVERGTRDEEFRSAEVCLAAFAGGAPGRQDALTPVNFGRLCERLLRDEHGRPYRLEDTSVADMFRAFDVNGDGYVDGDEWQRCWERWVSVILKPRAALLVVDVQNDFITGSMRLDACPAGEDGAAVIEPINALLASGRTYGDGRVYYSLDWHPAGHASFEEAGGRWPAHCIQGEWGARAHDRLRLPRAAIAVRKGTRPDVDAYSAFVDERGDVATPLHELLREQRITDLHVCGIAWDYCVGQTALDALRLGYRTVVLDDCTRSIERDRAQRMRDTIAERRGLVAASERAPLLAAGTDRPPQLAYHLALALSD